MLTIRRALDHKVIDLHNTYQDRCCFLICGGPSINPQDFEANYGLPISTLYQPNVFKMTVNNACSIVRPNATIQGDGIDKFIASQYLDSTIINFAVDSQRGKHVFLSNENEFSNLTLSQCPNAYTFDMATGFDPAKWLTSDKCVWGNQGGKKDKDDGKNDGSRSTMLAAIRMLYHLGFRSIFMLGVDFEMNSDKRYAFAQGRTQGAIGSNTKTYTSLMSRFTKLKPHFIKAGLYIYNCNPKSKLNAFPHVPLAEAFDMVKNELGCIDVLSEKTDGLYDRAKVDQSQAPKLDTVSYHYPLHDDYARNPVAVGTSSSNGVPTVAKTSNAPQGHPRALERKGYLFYNWGDKKAHDLLLSIYSLRKFSTLPVTVIHTGQINNDLIKYKNILNFKITQVERCEETHRLAQKIYMNTHSPYDRFVFCDADTIFLKNPDELFEKYDVGFGVPQFSDHTTQSRVITERFGGIIKMDMRINRLAEQNWPMTNTGLFMGYKDSPVFQRWQDLNKRVHADKVLCQDRGVRLIYDELLMNALVPFDNNIFILPNIYNCSGNSGCMDMGNVVMVHYHSDKSQNIPLLKHRIEMSARFSDEHKQPLSISGLYGRYKKEDFND